MTRHLQVGVLVAAVFSTIAFPVGAPAQEAAERIEEIVVTARFREETNNDIGASIVAFDGEELSDLGIERFNDIVALTPSLNLQDRGPNRNEISVRGVGRLVFPQDFAFAPANIGTYLDDVPINVITGVQLDVRPFDLDRVEVLRGPQGTLFGEGAEGGAIRYFTRDPDLQAFGGRAEAYVNSIESGSSDGGGRLALNIPLIKDQLALRLVGNRVAEPGFIDNAVDGTEDVNDYRAHNFRGVLLAEPNERFRIRLLGTYEDFEQDAAYFADGDPDDSTRIGFSSDGDFVADEYYIVSGNLSYDFGPLSLVSITSYYDRERSRDTFDTVFSILTSIFTNPAPSTATAVDTFNWEQFSQEVRLVSNFDGPLDFVAGAFYRDFDAEILGDFRSDTLFLLSSLGIWGPGLMANPTDLGSGIAAGLGGTGNPNRTANSGEQISAFVEATWAVSDRMRLIAGVRWHNESITASTDGSESLAFLGFPSVGAFTADVDVDEILPKVGVEYDAGDDVLLYFNYSSGVRNGNLNSPATLSQIESAAGPGSSDPFRSFGAERADSLEAGFKAALAGGTVQLNATAFHTFVSDLQVATFPTGAFAIFENVGDGHTTGLELETRWKVNERVSLFAVGNYTEAENDDVIVSYGAATPTPLDDVVIPKGTPVPYVPEFTFALGGHAEFPLQNGWTAHAWTNYQYSTDYIIAFEDPNPVTNPSLGDYGIWNLGFIARNDRLRFALDIDNVLDERRRIAIQETDGNAPVFGLQPILDAGYSFNENNVNRPRTITFTVGVEF